MDVPLQNSFARVQWGGYHARRFCRREVRIDYHPSQQRFLNLLDLDHSLDGVARAVANEDTVGMLTAFNVPLFHVMQAAC